MLLLLCICVLICWDLHLYEARLRVEVVGPPEIRHRFLVKWLMVINLII